MPIRPTYAICPGDLIEVEIVQPDGGRALVVGKLDAVPEAAGGQGVAQSRFAWSVGASGSSRQVQRR